MASLRCSMLNCVSNLFILFCWIIFLPLRSYNSIFNISIYTVALISLILIEFFEDYLLNHSEDNVIWKLNQERKTSQPIVKAKLVKVIIEEKTFLELIQDSNLIILDRPSTTSLEACMTKIPLFVLLANKNWYELPEKLLRKRV